MIVKELNGSEIKGFIAFLENIDFLNNPYSTELEYKDWCNGWRTASNATKEEISIYKWKYSF